MISRLLSSDANLADSGIPWVVINVAPPVFEMIGLGVPY